MEKVKGFRKVIILSTDFPPWTGGVAQLLHNIAVGFSRRGLDVLAVAPRYWRLEHRDNGLPYKIKRIPLIRGFFEAAAFLIILLERLTSKEVVVVCGTWVPGGFPLMLLHLISGLRYFMVVYAMDVLSAYPLSSPFIRKLRSFYLKKSFGRAQQVWAISDYTKKLVESYSINPDKIRIFPLPLREDFERILKGERVIESEPHEGRIILMTVGKLVPYKGQDQVIRILPRIREKFGEVEYHLVGDGYHEDFLRQLAAEHGVEDHVKFHGSVKNEKLPELYALCDIFIMVSREDLNIGFAEGFGLVYLEANSLGKPVVGGKSGGVPSAVEDGTSGLLADPHNPDDIFDKVSRLIADAEYAKKLGEQGRERVKRGFLVEHMMQSLEDFLEKAAGSSVSGQA